MSWLRDSPLPSSAPCRLWYVLHSTRSADERVDFGDYGELATLRGSCRSLCHPRVDGSPDFDSGSDGSDGALDPDDDNILHFTSVRIPPAVTLLLTAGKLNFAPVYWLVSGEVLIEGTVDLSGGDGHRIDATERQPSTPGPGGFPGGVGQSADSPPTSGFRPGGGTFGVQQGIPAVAGGGYGTAGGRQQFWALSPTYGNRFIIPLIGGSGGSGRLTRVPGVTEGGGAGGGALLIASSRSVTVNQIIADGGDTLNGGAGSGGAIRILAPVFAGSGRPSAGGGRSLGGSGAAGGSGRIRVETGDNNFTGQMVGEHRIASLNRQARFLPEDSWPSVRVTEVAGVAVSPTPTGNFDVPDIAIDSTDPVTIDIEAKQIPLGTKVSLYLFSEDRGDQEVETTPLAGTEETSTATAEATFPADFSRIFIRATW